MSGLINEFLKRSHERKLNIHCVGDAMVDEYYDVKVNRISPEAPMSIMTSIDDEPVRRPGGAANVAYQFRRFNVSSTLICLPDFRTRDVFQNHGLNCFFQYTTSKFKLPVKKRFLDDGIQITRHDIESPYCGVNPNEILDYTTDLGEVMLAFNMSPDVAILSDYNKGFFHSNNGLNLYRDTITIVDPKKDHLEKWKGCTIFKPNAAEAAALTGLSQWEDQANFIQTTLGCESVVITHSSEKVCGIHKGELFCHNSNKVNVQSVVGAGDCFSAFLAMAVGHGFEVPDAVEIADTASSIYVQHRMNRPVCPAELIQNQIAQPQDLVNRDFKLVFTNGVYDLLHKGHMQTLSFAKSKGDKLVVALNSDASVKRLKGESRPIVPLEQRMAVMSNIRHVDFVCCFDEDTPLEIIKLIRPDVLVKGGQYDINKIIGADIVPEVYRAPMIDELSTTNLLSKA